MIRFAASCTLTVLFSLALLPGQERAVTSIDSALQELWKERGIAPAERCTDEEFLRRVTLDVTGTVPSLERAYDFLKDKAPGKREAYVDELLAGEAYAEYWSSVWAGILVGFSADRRDLAVARGMDKAMRTSLSENKPYDQFVRELITANGEYEENPLVLWYMQWLQNDQRALDMAGKMSRTFMGVQIQCAQCHDHPFDKWTQEDFYGMAAFFARVQPQRRVENRREVQEKKEKPEYRWTVRERRRGEVRAEGAKADAKPVFLGTGKGVEGNKNRREAFASMLTSPQTRQFAAAYVNRMWFYFFGRGIVHPFDDFNESNRPVAPAVLDLLTEDFVASGYDMKKLIRWVVLSEAYQRSSVWEGRDREDAEGVFAVARMRSLSPDQMLNTIFESCGVEDIDVKGRAGGLGKEQIRERLRQQFRFTFGDDEGMETSDFEGTIPQALLMMNGKLIEGASTGLKGSRLERILREHRSSRDRIDAIFLSVLTRLPTDSERSRYEGYVSGGGPDLYRDVLWTLLNSTEFMLNH